jgi:PAS domain S-box-containing protein
MNDKVNFLKFFLQTGKNFNTSSIMDKITDVFPAIIYVYDVENKRILYTNGKFSDYFGLHFDDIKDSETALFDVVFREDLDRIKTELDNFYLLQDSDSHCFNCRLMNKQGGWKYFRTSGSVINRNVEGRPSSFLFVAEDITDHLKSSEENETLKQLFAETESQLMFGSWTRDYKTNTTTWTQGLYNIFGYTKEEVKEITRDFYFDHVLIKDREALESCIAAAKNKKENFEVEYTIQTKTGDLKTVSTTGKIVLDENGEVSKIFGITRDLTEQRNLQKEQDRMLRELNRSNKELEEFAYIASHDLQEPLRKISMFTERLRAKYAGTFDKEGELFLDRVLGSASNMRNLMDNLLEFSRANRSSSGFISVNLTNLVNQVVADLELKIEESNCKISFLTTLPTVEAVPTEMKQLFTNLFTNAIKFAKKDTPCLIEISAHKLSKEEKVVQRLVPDGNFYSIEVRDNGIGFETEYSERIFQIFQRLHGKAEYPGSGIGLAICKKIIDNHNGVIFARSLPEAGATFTIILPENQF